MKAMKKTILPLTFAAMVAVHGAAAAHAKLKSATPASDAQVSPALTEVVLRFNEKLEATFSRIEVFDKDGKSVSAGKAMLDAADPSVMKVAVPALVPGKYTVRFAAVGGDGHRRTGAYSFTVK
jgi:methionine-rich copper-binding protein CopC